MLIGLDPLRDVPIRFGCSSLRVRSRVTRVSEFLGESADYRKGYDRSDGIGAKRLPLIDLPVVG